MRFYERAGGKGVSGRLKPYLLPPVWMRFWLACVGIFALNTADVAVGRILPKLFVVVV